jgi:tetrahedral aminopeptidase
MLLKKLSEAIGVSGREEEVRALLVEEIRGRVDEARVDGVGNLIARKRGTGSGGPRVLLAAHMDEIGLMISQAEDSGLLRFAKVGGIDDRILPAKAVLIGEKRVPGVIAFKPVHLLEKGERDQVPSAKTLGIDIGAASKAEAERLVKRGDTAVFAAEFKDGGGSTAAAGPGSWRTVQGKAFDDRAGCTVLATLLSGSYPVDISAAFTVQEEVGLRGARVAAYAEEPAWAIVLECTGANEIPVKRDLSPSTRLGAGPAITVMDSSFIADRGLVSLFLSTAQELGIPVQVKQPGIGGTDAGAIHLSRGGVPSVTIAVPCRYIHSPAGILNLDDLEQTILLVREALQRLPEAMRRSNS